MARQEVHVGISLSDSGTAGAIRGLLAAPGGFCVTTIISKHNSIDPRFHRAAYPGGTDDMTALMDVALFGREDLLRFEEDDPERFNNLRARTKILVVLGSDELVESTDFIRMCDGMVVRDVNLARIAEIVECALLGYFAIPSRLAAILGFDGRPMRRIILEHMSRRERQVFELLLRGHSDAAIAKELKLAEATVKLVVRRIFDGLRDTSHSHSGAAITVNGTRENGASITKGPRAMWRKALRDDRGMSRIESVILIAAVGVWAAVTIEGLFPGSDSKAATRCVHPNSSAWLSLSQITYSDKSIEDQRPANRQARSRAAFRPQETIWKIASREAAVPSELR